MPTIIDNITNIKYARIHQLGGTIEIGPHPVGPAHVKEHKRKYKGKTVTVRSHERSGYLNLMGSGKRTIPARPYLGLDAQAREDIQQTIRLKKPNIKSAGCLTRRKV